MPPIKTLTDAEFELFRELVYKSCGILFTDKNRGRLDMKVGERAGAAGHDSASEYYRTLVGPRTPERDREIKTLLDVLTINETYFYRNKPQIEIFTRHAVPEIAERKLRAPGAAVPKELAGLFTPPAIRSSVKPRLQIWSAGCSTGQEPYTLALALHEGLGLKVTAFDLRIFATDISETSLETARAGIYERKRLDEMDERQVGRLFEPLPDGRIRVREEFRRLVTFQYGNLKERAPFRQLDAIFCRNVMIYFDAPMQRHIVSEFHAALGDGGWLFIGHSESLQAHADLFDFTRVGGGIAYRKRPAAATVSAVPAGKAGA